MRDLEEALSIVASYPAYARFVGPRPEELVRRAEEAIGFPFPATYRRFVLELGAGSFGSREFYGVIDDDFENSCVPDGVWFTLDERQKGWLPADFFATGVDGFEGTYCIRLNAAGQESPVIVFDVSQRLESTVFETLAPDFGRFFLDEIKDALELGFGGVGGHLT